MKNLNKFLFARETNPDDCLLLNWLFLFCYWKHQISNRILFHLKERKEKWNMAWIEPDTYWIKREKILASIFSVFFPLRMHENQRSGMAIKFGSTYSSPRERLQFFFLKQPPKFTMTTKQKKNPSKASNFWLNNLQQPKNQNKNSLWFVDYWFDSIVFPISFL